jgi:DHA1 family multidrug resistance protein-like MFS transporter
VTFASRLRLPEAFDRDLTLLTISISFRRIDMGFLQIVRSIYFALLGFSPVEIGVLLSFATFISAIHHILFGYLSDRYGRKPFLILGGIFATARLVIFATYTDFWMLAIGQGIGAMGEGAGAGQPVVSGYITDKTEIRQRASVFSTFAITNALATTVGSLMAGLPATFQGSYGLGVIEAHKALFWIGTVGNVISLATLLLLKDIKPLRVSDVDEGAPKKRSWGVITKFSLVRATSGLGQGLIDSLMPLYFFINFGLGGEFLGPIYAGARFLSMFSYFLVPRIVDRFGDVRTLVASRLITAILTVGFALSTWLPASVALLIALRVVMLFTMPIRQVFATGIVSADETATAIGVSNFARMSSRTVAPTAAGYMFEAVSLASPFIAGSAFLIANAILYRKFFQAGPEVVGVEEIS